MPCSVTSLAKIAAIGLAVMLAACAPRYPTSQQPVNQGSYNQDLANCQQQAASSFPSAMPSPTACARVAITWTESGERLVDERGIWSGVTQERP